MKYNEYMLSTEELEEREEKEDLDNLYIVFEEDQTGSKNYDLTKGVFNDFEVAKKYAEDIHQKEDLFIAEYKKYIEGNYDYLYEVR